jgi:ABC-type bacteriocin/lantibiotic exporter with double-glycine peptidase domain
VACLRMVFEHYGVQVSEEELAVACKTTSEGTSPSNAITAAIQYGFEASRTGRFDFDTLREQVEEELLPIVFIDFLPRVPPEPHAVIIFDITGDEQSGMVYVLDPDRKVNGERMFTVSEFKRQWENANFRTIIVRHT